MCISCIYKGRKELDDELQVLVSNWALFADEETVPMARALEYALRDLQYCVVRMQDPEKHEPLEWVGELAMRTGGAHYVVRFLTMITKECDPVAAALITKTRRLTDFFYTCLSLPEPPTLDMQNAVDNLKAHVSKMVENGFLVPVGSEKEEVLN
jgi:hypothetical protein